MLPYYYFLKVYYIVRALYSWFLWCTLNRYIDWASLGLKFQKVVNVIIEQRSKFDLDLAGSACRHSSMGYILYLKKLTNNLSEREYFEWLKTVWHVGELYYLRMSLADCEVVEEDLIWFGYEGLTFEYFALNNLLSGYVSQMSSLSLLKESLFLVSKFALFDVIVVLAHKY